MRPAAAAPILGSAFFWCVAGGWALEAAGAPPRPHGDLDVAVLARDLGAVREALSGYELWEARDGVLTPLAARPRAHQLWIRRPGGPWLLDLMLEPSDGDDWVYRRDPRVRRPLASATFSTGGVRYLRPEIALLFAAKAPRPKDVAALGALVPRLGADARSWLAAALATAHPDAEITGVSHLPSNTCSG